MCTYISAIFFGSDCKSRAISGPIETPHEGDHPIISVTEYMKMHAFY